MNRLLPFALLAVLVLPAWPLLGGGYLADPLSELPVRLWCHERIPLFGGLVDSAAFPNVGPLNDPDPLGTLVTGALRPVLGRAGAFNVYVLLHLALTLFSTWALCKEVVGDARASMVGAVAFALTPLALVYGVAGAVVDLLAVWPWALAARSLIRAWRGDNLVDPLLAGAWAAVGFVASPYHALVFAALAVPAVLWGAWHRGEGLLPHTPVPTPRRVATVFALVVVAGLALAGPYAAHMRAVMDDPASQMSASAVDASRHTWPFPLLSPDHTHRYVAYLADYVAVGKTALIERVAAARFYRAFSPGLSLFGLAAAGLLLSRDRRVPGLWLFCAGFAILASTGPWMPVTRTIASAAGVNPAWWLLHVLPGGDLLLEPFRYGLAAALALSVAAAIGAAALARRYGPWVPFAAVAVWLVELVVVSPVPFPLPTADLEVPAAYAELDARVPPGAVIELPYYDRGSDRFNRQHFLHQLVHGRPIADEVLGFPPRYLVDNQFTAGLLQAEKGLGALAVKVTDFHRVDADRARLAADGFSAIVVDFSAYASPGVAANVRRQLETIGEPVPLGDREVWILE